MSTSRLSRTSKTIPKPKLMEKVEETIVESEDLMKNKTPPPPTDTMKVTEAVVANMADFNNLLDSVNNTPVGSNKKSIRAVLTTQDRAFGTPKAEDDKTHEEMEVTIEGSDKKESQVQWKDPEEEAERRKLTDQLNTLETQDLSGRSGQEKVQNNLDSLAMETMGSFNVDNLTAIMDQGKPQSPLKKIILVSGWNEKEPDVVAAVEL